MSETRDITSTARRNSDRKKRRSNTPPTGTTTVSLAFGLKTRIFQECVKETWQISAAINLQRRLLDIPQLNLGRCPAVCPDSYESSRADSLIGLTMLAAAKSSDSLRPDRPSGHGRCAHASGHSPGRRVKLFKY
eukprot:764818-Hanusia_phi.AAC.1